MIDYGKLREAHELADQAKIAIRTQTRHVNGKYRKFLGWIMDFSADNSFESIDDLITKLKELTQPEPKYKEGSQVWFTECGDIRNGYIKSIRNDSYLIDLNDDVSYCEKEDDLYPTKSQLIEAQIQYWQSLRDQSEEAIDIAPTLPDDFVKKVFDHYDAKECQHQSDGHVHTVVSFGACVEKINKCIKCGEFYR